MRMAISVPSGIRWSQISPCWASKIARLQNDHHSHASGALRAREIMFMGGASVRLMAALSCGCVCATAGERNLNNLASELVAVSSISGSGRSFDFTRKSDGWVFLSASCKGTGMVRVVLDKDAVIVREGAGISEGMRYVTKGPHTIRVEAGVADRLVVRAIPELIHSGLGFDPQIKSYGVYDMDFLKPDILPNATTLIVPNNIKLSELVIDDWH